MSPSDDVRGVVELQAGRVGTFEEIYREHRIALLRLAYLMCGSRDHAEEVVQTAFTDAYRRWATIENHLAYLRRSVINLVKDGQRRRFRRRHALTADREPVTDIPEIDETWALVKRLPATQRSVIVLRYYADLTLADIAELLDRPTSTVRSDHRRALDRLRKAMS